MADKEIIKKSTCHVCGANVNYKKAKTGAIYYACSGEISATSCGSRMFFGQVPSFKMLTEKEKAYVPKKTDKPTSIAQPRGGTDNSGTDTAAGNHPAGDAGKPAGKSNRWALID